MSEADARCDHHNSDGGHAPHAPHELTQAAPGHSHGGHSHRSASRARLLIVIALTSSFMIVELIAGFYTGSLALMADAGHMLSDVAAQGLALLAIWFASRPPTADKSYGYYRTEILASLINGVVLIGISIFIVWEAVRRLSNPPEVHGAAMLAVAAVGLVINLLCMRVLHAVANNSLNMKAAYLELLGDLLASCGVLLAAGIVTFSHWYMADPIISILIGILILPRTWLLLAECTNILMEGTPSHIDIEHLRSALRGVPGVLDVHDIHVWTITSGLDAMSGHVCVDKGGSPEQVLSNVTKIAQKDFGIQHTTIQVELVSQT